MLEARFKLLEREASESDYYKEKFERQFKWRITPDRLEKLMQLKKECRAVFFSTFDNLYKFANLFGSQAFDQAIKGMKENAEFFTDSIKRQREYWDFVLGIIPKTQVEKNSRCGAAHLP
jgi:hypothetical protein